MLFGIKRTKGYMETETIAEAVKNNDKKKEMEKPHFLVQDPAYGPGPCGFLPGLCLYIQGKK